MEKLDLNAFKAKFTNDEIQDSNLIGGTQGNCHIPPIVILPAGCATCNRSGCPGSCNAN